MSNTQRLKAIYDQYIDIVASGNSDFTEWHIEEINTLFKEMDVTQPEMIELMDMLYGPDSNMEGCTMNEVKMMMERAGLTEFTIKLTSFKSDR